ncbi:MAG: PilN domain-containing protein [Armatimonadetes bacterium]|nr:PilN domain-containing protein [Armatimonadota bacterium]
MPSINMIASRRAERKKLERHVRVAALALLCIMVAGFGVMSFMTARIYAIDRATSKLDAELAHLQPVVDQIAQYESEAKKLEPRLELLADSREKTLLWHNVMQNVSRSMPANTWLTSVSTSTQESRASSKSAGPPPAPKVSVKMRGTSSSQMMVGEAMLRLNRWPEFDAVDLNFTQQTSRDDLNLVEFEISALLKNLSAKGGGSPNGSK